jgi:hypothetical protein
MATKIAENYTGTRITFHSSHPFSTIISKLYASIGTTQNIQAWSEIARNITDYSTESKQRFVQATEKQVGRHGFMIFQVR